MQCCPHASLCTLRMYASLVLAACELAGRGLATKLSGSLTSAAACAEHKAVPLSCHRKQAAVSGALACAECRLSAHAGDAKRARKSGQVLGSNVGNEVFYGALYYGLKVPPGTAACPHETRAWAQAQARSLFPPAS